MSTKNQTSTQVDQHTTEHVPPPKKEATVSEKVVPQKTSTEIKDSKQDSAVSLKASTKPATKSTLEQSSNLQQVKTKRAPVSTEKTNTQKTDTDSQS